MLKLFLPAEGLDCSVLFVSADFDGGLVPHNITCMQVILYQLAMMPAAVVAVVIAALGIVTGKGVWRLSAEIAFEPCALYGFWHNVYLRIIYKTDGNIVYIPSYMAMCL